jgi:serine/threonine protein kinase
VLDFGIARILPDAPAAAPHQLSMPTDTGVVVGTPRFVSPEGAIGLRVDQRADIYAAGLVLYAMLVGRGPFDHVEGQQRVLSAHALEDPEPPSRFAQEPVPPELDRAVLRALAKDPAERFQTADEFKALLEQIQEMLNRPSGWLETSRFDPRALLEMPQREPVSEWTQPAPVSEAKAPPAAFSPARRAAPPVQVGGLERATGDTQGTQARPSRGLLVLLFVCVALLVGVVVAGLLALLRGHGP